MERINITIRQETLHNVITQLRHENALAILQTIFGAIKSKEWNKEISRATGETVRIPSQKKLAQYLMATFSPEARRELRKTMRRNVKQKPSESTTTPKSLDGASPDRCE